MKELQADIDLLLECIKCQEDNSFAVRQSLLTLTSICSSAQELAQDHLRKCGGLLYLASLLASTVSAEVKQATMYALGCAIDKNVYSQKVLSVSSVFSFLCATLSSPQVCSKTLHTATFLLLSLVANNGAGQLLVRTSGCLEQLMIIIRGLLPAVCEEGNNHDLFTATTSALCACVNNPQNDENQRAVASLFPVIFQFFQHNTVSAAVIKSLAALLGLAVANNVHNQNRIVTCRGVEALVGGLHRVVNRISTHEDDRSSSNDNTEAALVIINTLDTLVTDNASNADRCGELGIISLLLRLLDLPCLHSAAKVQVALALGHCVENSKENHACVVRQGGMSVLVQLLGQTHAEEHSAIIKYALQQCVTNKESSGSVLSSSESSAENIFIKNDKVHQKLLQLEAKLASASEKPFLKENPIQLMIPSPIISTAQTNHHIEKVDPNAECIQIFEKKSPPSFKWKTVSKNLFLKPPKMNIMLNSSSTDSSNPKAARVKVNIQQQPTKADMDKVKKQLQEERLLRQRLEKEVRSTRALLAKHDEEERAAAEKSELIMQELERQHKEQQEADTGLAQQLMECQQEHDRLLELKQQKQQEMTSLEQQLATIEVKLHNSSSSPAMSLDAISQYTKCRTCTCESNKRLGDFNQRQGPISVSTPVTRVTVAYKAMNQHADTDAMKYSGTPRPVCSKTADTNSGRLSPTVLASGQKCRTKNSLRRNEPSKIKQCGTTSCYKASNESTKNCDNTEQIRNKRELPRLLTPIVMTTKPKDDVFVKPVAPMKRRNTTTTTSSQNSLSCGGKSYKRQLFTPGQSNAKTSRDNTLMSGCHMMSPCSTIQSEFDRELLQQASSGNSRYWTDQRIVNYVTACPSVGVGTPVSVRRIGPKFRKKNLVVPHKKTASSLSVTSYDVISQSTATIQEEVESDESPNSKHSTSPGQIESNHKCPGCEAPNVICGPVLNSRTYSLAVETSQSTCAWHRQTRDEERINLINKRRKLTCSPRPRGRMLLKNVHLSTTVSSTKKRTGMAVYDFTSSVDQSSRDRFKPVRGPVPKSSRSVSPPSPTVSNRRPRVPYTEQEELNLRDGVAKMGRFWSQILHTYQFHASRTAVDLKDKYRAMKKKSSPVASVCRSPAPCKFSMVEDRRLRRGVRQCGYSWTAILASFQFAPTRTAGQLRDRWRDMHTIRPGISR